MNRKRIILLSLAFALMIGLPVLIMSSRAGAGSAKSLSLAGIPLPVLSAFLSQLQTEIPDFQVLEIEVDKELGGTEYEFDCRIGGHLVELVFLEDGTLHERELDDQEDEGGEAENDDEGEEDGDD